MTECDPCPRILWRDSDLIAVEKPAGLLSHPGADARRPDLVSWLRREVEAEQLVMHHRLDRETSGLLVLTLSKRACAPMAKAFADRLVEKSYRAWVCGQPPRKGQIDVALGEVKGRVRVDRAGKVAVTEFLRIHKQGRFSALELRPKQGRKHQLRVHCQHHGWPIVGDRLYGGEVSSRLWLHAFRLAFAHPVTGEPVRLECPLPTDWLSIGGILGHK